MDCGYGNCIASDHSGICKCYSGFELVGDICVDIDECLKNPCHSTAL